MVWWASSAGQLFVIPLLNMLENRQPLGTIIAQRNIALPWVLPLLHLLSNEIICLYVDLVSLARLLQAIILGEVIIVLSQESAPLPTALDEAYVFKLFFA